MTNSMINAWLCIVYPAIDKVVNIVITVGDLCEIVAERLRDIWRKASSKSSLKLNSLQKSHWAHMSISLRSGARGLERLIRLKYYNVQKRQITFALGLNATESTDYMKKIFE